MNSIELLSWIRGPGFIIATAIFGFGISLRLLEIVLLSRDPDYSRPRGSRMKGGLHTIFSRFTVEKNTFRRSTFVIITGYLFHLGFFTILLLAVPHIIFFQEILGFGWPGLPTALIDMITVISLLAMIALLVYRLKNPVLRFLSTFEDYLVWTVTFLPLLTGYMAYHHSVFYYPLMLGLHLLSVEILLIILPFTKLMHSFTFILARWYQGSNAGHKGIKV